MPTTRAADKNDDAYATEPAVGTKHDVDDKPVSEAKRTKTEDAGKQQTTIEDTLPGVAEKPKKESESSREDGKEGKNCVEEDGVDKEDGKTGKDGAETQKDGAKAGEVKAETAQEDAKPPSAAAADDTGEKDNSSAVEPGARADVVPSSILEKGIIYFFFRPRVGVEEAHGVEDVARSFVVLRPVARDAQLGAGPIGDAGNSRLLAVPKKTLPTSGRDRWISFVEKTHASFATLKDDFLSGEEYDTKTAGTRHAMPATPVGEGVYAITSTGRESHLAYVLTLPRELGDAQTDIGLKRKGSFIMSTKNPETPSPGNMQMPKGPEYPKEVQDGFRNLRWAATTPAHLDYANTQILLVGESSGLDKAVEQQSRDAKAGREAPGEELEKLEDEDTRRMRDLAGDDAEAVYRDLQAGVEGWPDMVTTF